ncbi:MAG: hypothetical protein ACI376_06640 [Candidatus Bruticola sp.]
MKKYFRAVSLSRSGQAQKKFGGVFMSSSTSGWSPEKESGSHASDPADISKYTGLIKLAAQVSRHEIEPEIFLQGVYDIFKELEKAYTAVKVELGKLKDEDNENYLKALLESIDDAYYIIRLGLMQFEAFVNKDEALGLRVGMQLTMNGIKEFNDITARVQAAATGDNLYNSKDIICALGSAVLQNNESIEDFLKALQGLEKIFEPLENEVRRLQEEVINGAKELIDFDGDEEALIEQALKVRHLLPRLEDAYGYLIIASHSPKVVNQVCSDKIVNYAVK